jgi:hypothetical protein
MIDFVNLKIKSAQSFRDAHRYRVHLRVLGRWKRFRFVLVNSWLYGSPTKSSCHIVPVRNTALRHREDKNLKLPIRDSLIGTMLIFKNEKNSDFQK